VTQRRSFTLVEMVLVIMLTLILTSLSIKGLRGVSAWRSASAIQRVQADILHARNQALLSGRRTVCILDLDSHTYEIQQETTPASGPISAAPIEHPLSREPWRVALQELSGGLRISAAPTPTFGFGVDGMLVGTSGAHLSGDINVTFSNGATLTVLAGSGLPEVDWP